MLYKDFKDYKLSRLGFGMMRLPEKEKGVINQEQVEEMVDYAISHGVNYFDTAWIYFDGGSEISTGKALKKYPRESWYLADKYPAHQIERPLTPEKVFEEQLRRCDVDYFDFYLMHNVYEKSVDYYTDPEWAIPEYFLEQRRKGRIKHLGFSCHAQVETLKAFLETDYGKEMEFCQIQLNYMDWSLQNAREKCRILKEHGLAIWVMEPVRGGKLIDIAPASMAFRWLATVPDVTMILSGMSNMAQVKDNVNTFQDLKPLSTEEVEQLYNGAKRLEAAVPCTACRYCVSGCPMGLDIPSLIRGLNLSKIQQSTEPLEQMRKLPADKQASCCIACGKCTKVCPQHIAIPEVMKELVAKLETL